MSKLPLEGIRVIDCSHIVAGPFTSMLLAQAGAQVIKLEPPGTGERLRRGASIPNAIGERAPLNFIALNRGKLGITLNLRDPQGKDAFKKLVAVSDVLVENYRPGALKELGLAYDVLKAVNPRLIYASISGFGKRTDLRGPYSDWTAHNPSAQAMSGLMDGSRLPDGPPMQVGAPIGDTIPALWTAYGVTLALRQREQTGTGQFLDIAMYDTMSMHNYGAVAAANVSSGSAEHRHQEVGPRHHMLFEAQDGWVMLSGAGEHEKWERLFSHIGRADLNEDRKYLSVDVKAVLEGWSKQLPRSEVCRVMLAMRFSPAPVQTAKDVYDCPQLAAREMFVEFEHLGRKFRLLGDPVKLSDVPRPPVSPPPLLGEHNEYVFGEIVGFSQEQIRDMKARGVL
jgi:crotonobetainyl-CoA:carnitine CoA-transferase CaiB-like acyl-CoA transferase